MISCVVISCEEGTTKRVCVHLSRNNGTCTLANRIASYSNSQRMDQYTCWAKSKNACSNLLLLLVVVVVLLLLLLLVDDDDDDDDEGASSCMDLARRCSHKVM